MLLSEQIKRIKKLSGVSNQSVLDKLIADFKGSEINKKIIDNYDDVEKLKGMCDTIAEKFAEYAIKNGVDKKDIKLIEGVGLKNGLGENCASGWEEYSDRTKFLSHVVVQVGKTVIDLTGRQFGKEYGKTVYSVNEFRSMFNKVKVWKTYDNEELMESDGRELGVSLSTQTSATYVTIYRACEAGVFEFRDKDYITLSQKFAVEHAENNHVYHETPYHVIRALVETRYVFNAYNPGEYFYSGPDKKGKEIYVSKGPDEYEGLD